MFDPCAKKEAPNKLIIACMYCKKCYGISENGEKKYFTPRDKYDNEKDQKESTGICPECFRRSMGFKD